MTTTDYNKFWSAAFDDMRDFVCLIDRDYNLVKANENFFKVFGGEKKLIGKKCFEIFHSLKKPFPGCPHGKMLETEVSEKGEFYEPSLKKYLSVTVTPIWGDDHKLIGSIHVAKDVTQLKEEGEHLKIRNDFIDKSMSPFAVGDLEGNLIYANAACLKMWGYASSKEVMGRPIIEFLKNEEKNAEIVKAYIKKKGWTGELTAKRKDGTTFDCHVVTSIVADNRGRPLHIVSSFADVTARNYMTKALGESEGKYRALVECTQEGVGFVDPNENITFVNQAFAEMLGYKIGELEGKNLKEITSVEEFEKYREETRKRTRGEKGRYETFLYRKDGSARFVSVSAAPLLDSHGNFNGTIGMVVDITELKRAQNEIKADKDYTDNIIKSMTDALIVVDSNARIKTLNHAALKMLSYKEDELIGKPVGMIVAEEEEEEEETSPFRGAEFRKLLKKGLVENVEMTWKNKSGKCFPVNFSGSAMRDRDGNLVGIVVVARDMREKKAAEDALKKSRKQYVDLVESLTDWVWEVDAKGRYTYASPKVKEILGYAPEKIIGKTPFDLMPAKEARRVAEIFKQLSAKQKPIVALENINRHKDGHQVFLETSGLPFYDDEGNFKGYRGTDRDVTDRKKASKLLEFYREYAENIVGHLPVSLIVVNRDLRINFANQHFLSKMRVTKENVAEKEIAKVLGNSVAKNSALSEKIMRVIKGEEARIEGRFILKSKTYDYMIVPIKEQTGRRLNALLVMEDVTKNVMMEEQLIHSEKLSAVGTFTASVAHEINNPLSIVVGNIQYLLANLHHMDLTRKKEVGEIVETLKTANSEAKRCAEIVTNLLHFSHKGASAKTKVSVNGVVTSTMKLLAHQLELSKVKTQIKLADGLPRVMCNADHLQQAFVNLILNAQQVMKEGGKLHVTTSLADNYVIVSFVDTGPGIPKKYIRKIFEPFYSTKEAGKGTGLGLFIIHSIMEEHGGKIEVQSKRGKGASFILKLPAVKKTGWFGG